VHLHVVDAQFKASLIQRIRQLLIICAPGPVILEALQEAFGSAVNSATGMFNLEGGRQIFARMQSEAGKYWADMQSRVLRNSGIMAGRVAANVQLEAKIAELIAAEEFPGSKTQLGLVIELPSPPTPTAETRLPQVWLPTVEVDGLPVHVGWSGHGGVFFGLGVSITEPGGMGPDWESKDHPYLNILRVDYWNYFKDLGPVNSYRPHYHVGDNDDHIPLN